jgi:hypothetical protein
MPPPIKAPSEFPLVLRIIGVISIIVLIVFLYSVLFPKLPMNVTSKGPFQLTNETIIVKDTENPKIFLNDRDEAVQMFVYLDGNVRMGQAIEGSSNGLNNTTGMYLECKCDNISCYNCDHTGYRKLINIQNTFILEILKTPDASRPNSVATQLYVKTRDGDTYHIETYPLSPIPEQKWVMITISKRGRQVYVYYNTKLILSKRALHNFSTQPSGCAPLRVGDTTLSGNVVMFSYYTNHQTLADVEATYRRMTDTRGNVATMQIVTDTDSTYRIVDETNTTFWSRFIKTLCLDFSCLYAGRSVLIPVIPPIFDIETIYR